MDILTTRPMTVFRMGTTGRIGLLAEYLSVQDRGSTGVLVFMAMSIIALIRNMDTPAQFRHGVHVHSIISRRMRPVTAVAMWSQHQTMTAAENTRCLVSVEAAVAARKKRQNPISNNMPPMKLMTLLSVGRQLNFNRSSPGEAEPSPVKRCQLNRSVQHLLNN